MYKLLFPLLFKIMLLMSWYQWKKEGIQFLLKCDITLYEKSIENLIINNSYFLIPRTPPSKRKFHPNVEMYDRYTYQRRHSETP